MLSLTIALPKFPGGILQLKPLEACHAAAILSWRYEPPYDLYNSIDASDRAQKELLRPELNYITVLDGEGERVAFRCFGSDAQVQGGDYTELALDLGGGLRPDLTGKVYGRLIMTAAMDYAVN